MKKHFLQESDSQDHIYDHVDEDSSYVDDPKLQMKSPQQAFMEPHHSAGAVGDKALKGNGRRSYNMPIQSQVHKPVAQLSGSSSISNNANSKIAAGPLSGNEASYRGAHHGPGASGSGPGLFAGEDGACSSDQNEQGPSDTDDDDEERLDCVHDIIHDDGGEADIEEIDCDDEFTTEHQVNLNDDMIDVGGERPLPHDLSMDGDIEDADGNDTERRFPKGPNSLFNKLQGVEQQSSIDSDQ